MLDHRLNLQFSLEEELLLQPTAKDLQLKFRSVL